MPIYEYSCQDCGTKFEKLVRRDSDALECPSCGKNHLQQELSVFSAHTHAGHNHQAAAPSCPSGGCCPNAGSCGMNFGG
jgi:putative FmdB family regulatory protein